MKLNPYLLFDGDCEAAIKFYEQALGAKTLSTMRVDGTPACAQMPPEMKDKVLHARFAVGELFSTEDTSGAIRSFLERGPGKAAFRGR